MGIRGNDMRRLGLEIIDRGDNKVLLNSNTGAIIRTYERNDDFDIMISKFQEDVLPYCTSIPKGRSIDKFIGAIKKASIKNGDIRNNGIANTNDIVFSSIYMIVSLGEVSSEVNRHARAYNNLNALPVGDRVDLKILSADCVSINGSKYYHKTKYLKYLPDDCEWVRIQHQHGDLFKCKYNNVTILIVASREE